MINIGGVDCDTVDDITAFNFRLNDRENELRGEEKDKEEGKKQM